MKYSAEIILAENVVEPAILSPCKSSDFHSDLFIAHFPNAF
jgi:hypothetical protein